MRRRKFIAAGGALAATLVAGCSSNRTRSIEAQELDGDGEFEAGEFRYALSNPPEDVPEFDVEQMYRKANKIFLIYKTTPVSLFEEIAVVGKYWAEYVADGADEAQLEVAVTDEFGEQQIRYRIKRNWAEVYNQDEVTDREYISKIMGTTARVTETQ